MADVHVTVNILPDNIFREVFAFCLGDRTRDPIGHMVEWQRLVHVCRRWRQIIYESPRYLDIHLHCQFHHPHYVPFRESLSRWPDFPLTVDLYVSPDEDDDDLIAALEHPNRVHCLYLVLSTWYSKVLEKMQVSFPALTHLELHGPCDPDHNEDLFDISHNFLGNTAPSLQYLYLHGIVFQELPKLLSSACDLVSLRLGDIPALGCPHNHYYRYISPQSMVGVLAGLTRLRTFCITFRIPHREDSDHPGSDERLEMGRKPEASMRTVLPALTYFEFDGESKYLEDLVARIDMPSVEDIKIEYFLPTSESPFEVRQLSQFIGRTANLELAQFRRAQVLFDVWYGRIKLDRPQGEHHRISFSLAVQISGSMEVPYLGRLVPCMARVLDQLGQLTTLLSGVGHLSVRSRRHRDDDYNLLDNSELLPLLYPFPTVKEMHVSGALAELIATMFERIAEERVIEVMPALHSLWLHYGDKRPPFVVVGLGSMVRFLSLRQLSGRPVTVRKMQDKAVG